jgi:tetratricopeptide (TPR) repeat protein
MPNEPREPGHIDRDFSKLRRQVLIAFGIILVILTFIGYHSLSPLESPAEKMPIVITDILNNSGDPELDGLSGMLIEALEQSRRLDVLTRTRMIDSLRQLKLENIKLINEQAGRALCKAGNISLLATGTVQKFGDLYSIDVLVTDLRSEKRLFEARADGNGEESVPSMIDKIAEQARSELQEPIEKLGTRLKVAQITTPNLEAYQHYFLGEQFLDQSQYPEAAAEFQTATDLDPEFGLAYYRLARSYEGGNEARSKDAFRKALQNIDRMPQKERLYVRAQDASTTGNDDLAILLYKEILRSYPSEKEALFQIGNHSYHLLDFAAAELNLGKALLLDPSFEPALQHLIWTYRDEGKRDRMTDLATQYVARRPESKDAYIELGSAEALNGDLDQALTVFDKAIHLFPRAPEPVLQAGLVHIMKDQYPEAEAQFRQLLRPTSPPRNKALGATGLALLSVCLGRYQDANTNIDLAREMAHGADAVHTTLIGNVLKAFCSYAVDKNPQKASELAKATAFGPEPTDSPYYLYLFFLELTSGDPQRASALFKQKLAFYPFGPPLLQAYLNEKGAKPDDVSRSLLKGTNNLASNNITFFATDLARRYIDAGNSDEAVRVLQAFQKRYVLYPPFVFGRVLYYARTYYLLGKAYEKSGNKEQAIINYETFLSLWKDSDKGLPETAEVQGLLKELKKKQR